MFLQLTEYQFFKYIWKFYWPCFQSFIAQIFSIIVPSF